MIEAGELLDLVMTLIALDTPPQDMHGQVIHELREHELA
jgi:hypothetical protein